MDNHLDHLPDDLPDDLPGHVRAYLAAHAVRDVDTALSAFADDAVVVDQDETFRGRAEIADFLAHAGSQYTYTTELLRAHRVDAAHWVVTVRIEGDFPGGRADLDERFTLTDHRIAELVIANAASPST